MPAYTFYIISNDVLSFSSGTGAFDFDAGYDYTTDRYRIEVSDDDATMNAGGDANQSATIYDIDDNIIASGVITVPTYIELSDGNFLDRIEIDGVHYGYLPMDPLTPGTSYPVVGSTTEELGYSYYETNSVPCFAPGTLIATREGEVPVHWIKMGSEVLTLDHGYQPVIWAGRWRVPLTTLQNTRRHWPVTIPPDPVRGARALVVSAAHQMMLRDPWFELTVGTTEVLCRSGLMAPAMRPASGQSLTWHHLLLPAHEVIRANGHWTESLFADGDVFADLPLAQQEQALEQVHEVHTTTARPVLHGYEAELYFNRRSQKAGNCAA